MNIFFYSQDHVGQAQGTKEAAPVSLSCHTLDVKQRKSYTATYTMSGPVWKIAVNRNLDFLSFAICQNFRKKMNEDVHNLPDDEPSIFFDVQTRL